jgi:hypothetical protein
MAGRLNETAPVRNPARLKKDRYYGDGHECSASEEKVRLDSCDIYENDKHYFKLKKDFIRMKKRMALVESSMLSSKRDAEKREDESNTIEKEIAHLKKEVKKSQKAQIEFLIKIVKIGSDTRNDGVVWAMRKIKTFNGMIREDHLPEYLDDKSKDFLIRKLKIYEDLLEKEA